MPYRRLASAVFLVGVVLSACSDDGRHITDAQARKALTHTRVTASDLGPGWSSSPTDVDFADLEKCAAHFDASKVLAVSKRDAFVTGNPESFATTGAVTVALDSVNDAEAAFRSASSADFARCEVQTAQSKASSDISFGQPTRQVLDGMRSDEATTIAVPFTTVLRSQSAGATPTRRTLDGRLAITLLRRGELLGFVLQLEAGSRVGSQTSSVVVATLDHRIDAAYDALNG